MNKHLRNYVRRQRELKGIRLGPLAETLGYKNRGKNRGCRLILEFEREGIVTEEFLMKLIHALQLDEDEINEAMEKDRVEWEEWANEPVPMQMILTPLLAVNILRALPPEITTSEEAENYARDHAKKKGCRVCLVLSRRESLWIGDDGEVKCRSHAKRGVPNIPYATVGGRRKFLFDVSGGALTPVVLKEF
jgi:hypothetical protein